MILFTFSPTIVAYIKPQRTCKSSTLDELLGPLDELLGVFQKATARHRGKQYPDTEKHSVQPF